MPKLMDAMNPSSGCIAKYVPSITNDTDYFPIHHCNESKNWDFLRIRKLHCYYIVFSITNNSVSSSMRLYVKVVMFVLLKNLKFFTCTLRMVPPSEWAIFHGWFLEACKSVVRGVCAGTLSATLRQLVPDQLLSLFDTEIWAIQISSQPLE